MKDPIITNNLDNLKEKDLYSIILYAIYKCTDDPQYSTISELIYSLDRDSLFNLCSIFGGCTIKIPTLSELKVYFSALLVYDLIQRGKSFNSAFAETGLNLKYKKDVIRIYSMLRDIINNYGSSRNN